MPNAKDTAADAKHKILVVGDPGSGKTHQVWTLPGRKFAYLFDPNALAALRGLDLDYEEFLPDVSTIDLNLKGFNKDAKSDRPKKPIEPTCYVRWEKHFNENAEKGFFEQYDWLIIDSLTLFSRAMMERLLFLNNRFGGIEDRSDYRIVGNKIATAFVAISSMKINLYATAHTQTFQDEKTDRIVTQLGLPGSSRELLPKLFSNIWVLRATNDGKQQYVMLTRAEPRGFQAIRSAIQGLDPIIDVTVKDRRTPENFGIGAVLRRSRLLELNQAINGPKPLPAPPAKPGTTTAAAAPTNKPDPVQGAGVSDSTPQP